MQCADCKRSVCAHDQQRTVWQHSTMCVATVAVPQTRPHTQRRAPPRCRSLRFRWRRALAARAALVASDILAPRRGARERSAQKYTIQFKLHAGFALILRVAIRPHIYRYRLASSCSERSKTQLAPNQTLTAVARRPAASQHPPPSNPLPSSEWKRSQDTIFL